MKTLIRQKNIILAVLTGFLLIPVSVSAVSPLDVTFVPDPLFSAPNALPGDGFDGAVTVTNNSGVPQTIITEAINVSDPDELSSQMTLLIQNSASTTFFSGNFMDFLTGGERTLTDPLANGASVTYVYSVDFLESAGDAYQETTLGFDICIGFESEDGLNCGDTTVGEAQNTDGSTPTEPPSNAGGTKAGSGGPSASTPLIISGEEVTAVNDIGGTATIEWDTNLYATSQVVYGPVLGGPYSLSILAVNFGYPFTTIENPDKVLHHAATLTGLTPGADYYYRVVSRASPPTVSYEHTFAVVRPEEAPEQIGSNVIAFGGGGSGGGMFAQADNTDTNAPEEGDGGSSEADRRAELEALVRAMQDAGGENEQKGEETSANDQSGEQTAAALFADIGEWLIYFLVAILLLLGIWLIFARRRHE